MLSGLRSFKRAFELDLRSLAICRIALGLLIFIDCIFRFQNFEAHYTNFGIMPLQMLAELYLPQGPCLHCWSDNQNWSIFLFVVHAAFALCMMLGWQTKRSIFMTWLLSISVQYRNPMIIDGGDVLLRCFLLWLLFLPTAEHFSLDARHKTNKATQTVWWLNAMLPLQLFLLYFFSALLKTGIDWWPDGTAIGYALSLEAFVTPLGKWLTGFPEGLKYLTRLIYLIELWGPFLLLCGGRLRAVGVLLFIAFHAGLALTMDLALFPWIAFACLFSLMPFEFWNFFKPPNQHEHTPRSFKISKLAKILSPLGAFFFLLAVSWNVFSYTQKALPKALNTAALYLHVDQYWGMFAPYPLKDSGWYEFGLKLWNGEYVYTFVNKQMESEWNVAEHRPQHTYKYFVDQRWRKYLVNIWERSNAKFRPGLAGYLCRRWNRDNPIPGDQALQVDMSFALVQNTEYLQPARKPSSIDLGSFGCSQDEY